MLGQTLRRTLVLLAGTALAAGTVGTPVAAQAVGPTWPYTKILNGQGKFIPLPDAAMITRTKHGYLYRAGQQDSHLVITRVCLLYTSPSPRDGLLSRMPSSA